MKIAQVAPLIERVPPEAYGGTERVVSYLTEALAAQGHEVTLFASGDSRTAATLVPMSRRSLRGDPARPDWLMRHVMMVDRVFEQAARFDVIHFHIDFLHYPLAQRSATPSVTTMHGRLDLPELRPLHAHFRRHPLVSISHHQRLPLPDAHWCATVHHGLPHDLYRFHEQPGDYFVFLGRLSPEKRVDRAIEIAVACGVQLRIAAKVDPVDRAYFEHDVAPLLAHPLVHFIGEVGDREKNDLLGNARALLFPIDWPEPFGLVMIEAFACGTPVVAYRCGSVPEVLDEGVTGFIVDDQAGAVEAARRIGEIDRRRCRDEFERRFTVERMASRYVEVYRALIAERAGSLA
ncbi:glycosyltransferase family 4 protein [Rubrivivax gelatinosus]|uniref:Glycosyl transferase, group 1 n=1 Tax=Rubrivivax gelatinosus (strain NBRC 100245 / IL144) TaxID=983917 RepID=I0HU81_RUBGI|nr:glycosyltransferase family 4 protein [Rubrivivax gelatinosus]BAL96568.1 glycosyl transferase, group 1 [Rubrivivax gelatinosus IL144]